MAVLGTDEDKLDTARSDTRLISEPTRFMKTAAESSKAMKDRMQINDDSALTSLSSSVLDSECLDTVNE